MCTDFYCICLYAHFAWLCLSHSEPDIIHSRVPYRTPPELSFPLLTFLRTITHTGLSKSIWHLKILPSSFIISLVPITTLWFLFLPVILSSTQRNIVSQRNIHLAGGSSCLHVDGHWLIRVVVAEVWGGCTIS